MPVIIMVDPTSPGPGRVRDIAPRLASLKGKRAGFRRQWMQFDKFVAKIEGLVKQQYEPAAVAYASGTFTERRDDKLEKWRKFQSQVDWALLGLGACWGTVPWTVYDALELEAQGVPTVSIVTEEFAGLAQETAAAEGCPGLEMIVVPHFFEELSDDAVARLAQERYPKIVAALTIVGPAR